MLMVEYDEYSKSWRSRTCMRAKSREEGARQEAFDGGCIAPSVASSSLASVPINNS